MLFGNKIVTLIAIIIIVALISSKGFTMVLGFLGMAGWVLYFFLRRKAIANAKITVKELEKKVDKLF